MYPFLQPHNVRTILGLEEPEKDHVEAKTQVYLDYLSLLVCPEKMVVNDPELVMSLFRVRLVQFVKSPLKFRFVLNVPLVMYRI